MDAGTLKQWFDAALRLFFWSGEVEWKQVVLIGMTPLFLLAFFVELAASRTRPALARQFEWREVLVNILLGSSYQLFDIAAHLLFVAVVVNWFYAHCVFDMPVNGWTILPLFVALEFCYYWFHRASHRIRWFWSAHVIHHSSERMNLSTAMRKAMLYPITGWWLFFMPLSLLGVPPAVVFFFYGVDLAYQYFVHTESVRRLPAWMEVVFVTPSHHRVHHGRNPCYIDKNFGGVLIVFDRLFGTFEPETEPVDYDIPRHIHSRNILTLNFHEFIDMWRDVLQPGPLGLRLRHLWEPPEWTREAREPAAPDSRGAAS
ncbi:MAG: sterol desaturase family protein [Candidatus Protistobacter heckmanni]|nr:sterol desaturase family protein [Candidatus Protistobacter heckmanni]